MVTTSNYPLTVDGVRLDNLAYNIETFSGRLNSAGKRGANSIIPGKHGSVYRPGKSSDGINVTLEMWVQGCDADGKIPTSSSEFKEFRSNLDALLHIFLKDGLISLVQSYPSGNREIRGEVTDVIAPKMIDRGSATMKVSIDCVDAFWSDTDEIVNSTVTNTTANATSFTASFAAFADMTAPIDDGIVVVKGPVNAPTVTDPITGNWVSLNRNLASTEYWGINAKIWRSVVSSSVSGAKSPSTTNQVNLTSYGGSRQSLIVVSPGATFHAPPQLLLTGTGMTAATSVGLSAKRKYR